MAAGEDWQVVTGKDFAEDAKRLAQNAQLAALESSTAALTAKSAIREPPSNNLPVRIVGDTSGRL